MPARGKPYLVNSLAAPSRKGITVSVWGISEPANCHNGF
uniref:Uncharacterized protein n=1 Tax=Anguilla anguilla TaxID=7936 RepID=A0A0E9SQF0_ANGAN